MNPVPRPMVYTAAVALAGVCLVGLYLGIQPSLERAADASQVPTSSAAPTPGMAAAVQAVPLTTDLPPPSAAPASSALALAEKPKSRPAAADDASASDTPAAPANAQAGRNPPEPPTLYSPDEAPAPPPAGANNANTPPY